MRSLNEPHVVELGGYEFSIYPLDFKTARKVLHICQPLVTGLASEDGAIKDIGPAFFAFAMKALDHATEEELIKHFATKTQVRISPEEVVHLGKAGALDSVFSGQHELVHAWLDECIKASFGSVMEKSIAATKRLQGAVAAKP